MQMYHKPAQCTVFFNCCPVGLEPATAGQCICIEEDVLPATCLCNCQLISDQLLTRGHGGHIVPTCAAHHWFEVGSILGVMLLMRSSLFVSIMGVICMVYCCN
jgi:hypothetical protein